jgi:hypothetical protein
MNITCAVATFTTRKMFEVMNLSNAFVYVIKRRIPGQFCHCHVFRPHHYRDTTGKGVLRELVDSVAPSGSTFMANNRIRGSSRRPRD